MKQLTAAQRSRRLYWRESLKVCVVSLAVTLAGAAFILLAIWMLT